jgi:hypothetical protein
LGEFKDTHNELCAYMALITKGHMLRDLLLENAEIISAKHMHATLIHTPIVTYLAGFVQERLATSQHCSALGAAVPVELSAVTHALLSSER